MQTTRIFILLWLEKNMPQKRVKDRERFPTTVKSNKGLMQKRYIDNNDD